MSGDRRQDLRRRYLSLGVGELAAAAVFALVAVTVVTPRLAGRREPAALCSALAPLLVILVQAGTYWLSARVWVERTTMPRAYARVYRAFRVADAAVLAAGLIGLLVWLPERTAVLLLVVAVWCFGVVEYINYFVVRLSYPIGQWFSTVGERRTPRLMQDVNTSAR